MVSGSAAVKQSSPEINHEDSQLPPQNLSRLVSAQSDTSALTKPKSRKHRRHHSWFSSSSVHSSEHPSPEAATSNGTSIRETESGRSIWEFKRGDHWYTRRLGKENQRSTDSAAEATAKVNTSVEIAAEDMTSMIGPSSSTPDGQDSVIEKRAPGKLHKDWRIRELWHNRRNETKKTASQKSSSTVIIQNPKTSRKTFILSSGSFDVAHLTSTEGIMSTKEASSAENSLHYTSLGIYTSSKFSSSDLEASECVDGSPPERSAEVTTSAPLAIRWKDIQGANNWRGLLDPLDLDLRKELLRYGDFAQMTYDNFEDSKWSKYAGSARYPKQSVFERLGKGQTGYQVTRYLYACCENPLPGILQSSLSSEKWDVESNWMGFVAVATDASEIERLGRRDIVVAWRGTCRTMEWLIDAQIQMAPMTTAPDPLEGLASKAIVSLRPKVEKGFWSLYTCKRSVSRFNQKSASEQVIQELTRLLTLYKGENLSITLTGHSLGGALAILTAYEIAEKELNKQTTNSGTQVTIPVTVFAFGSPRIGDANFRKRFEELQLTALRVVNVHDLVPKSIGGFHPPWGEAYKHVGIELQVNHKLSTYMKHTRDPVDWHCLEAYLHHIDGYQGSKSKAFKLVTERDYALINKYADILKNEYCVPPHWWQLENRGLVLSPEGRWVEPYRTMEDTPSLENQERFI